MLPGLRPGAPARVDGVVGRGRVDPVVDRGDALPGGGVGGGRRRGRRWIVHYTTSQPPLVTHNLIMGIAIGLLALGFTRAPERMYGLSWAMCALGVWMIISPWIVGESPDAGVVWNNIIIGALAVLLGLVCAGTAAKASPKP
ncbi:SPW repeat protein [Streptomyces violaceus]|uniref:SPW repeat protein n=1 Tax=Streptomyces violaceus TaxID=1936 RepID=UPI003CD0A84A